MRSSRRWGRVPVLSPLFAWIRLLVFIPLTVIPCQVDAGSPIVVRVEMVEFAFHPSTIRLSPGRPVTLLLVNRGQLAHQFESASLRATSALVVNDTLRVEAGGVDLVRLQPGAAAKVTFLPSARGRFSFACTIEGHREAGMVGSFDIR
jgi:uncharacterized cupredoxin-like copper-binding protein